MKALVFDTETTGFIKHPNAKPELQPKIIEFGGVLINTKGKVLRKIDVLINPQRPIPPGASKVNGIFDKDVANAPLFCEVVNDIAALFKKADVMIAHNLSFDEGMLKLELGPEGTIDFPWPKLGLCTVQENVPHYGYRIKMKDLYLDVLGTRLNQTHRALDDCRALSEIVIAGGDILKDSLPQLRIKTEYSFRRAYGPLPRVVEVLQNLRCRYAGIVDDGGTWGHVKWQKELKESNITSLFGAEFKLELGDGRRPTCWGLAEDIKGFYNFTSSNPTAPENFAVAPGVIRFSGHALNDPELFDYIDCNPSSALALRRALGMHKRTRKPLVLTSANEYPAPEDKNKFLAWVDNNQTTPQHILRPEDWRTVFAAMSDGIFKKAYNNTIEVAERIGKIELPTAPIISVKGNLNRLVSAGKIYRMQAGHIENWTSEYETRLKREMKMIKQKAYQSYFIVVADLVVWAKDHMLVGPARGSSAGSLVCYLLRITEVDPLVHGLLFERFIDINRDDLPDIDIDFADTKRPMVFDYLCKKYGVDSVAKIGNVNRLKPRSVMAHAGKKLGIPAGATFPVLNVLIEYSSGDSRYGKGLEDTLTTTQPGKTFLETYPEATLIGELENHASHTGVHAAGIIVANVPVIDYCTVLKGIAHLDKKDAEELNLLKIDALGLRTLGVIEDTGCVDSDFLYSLSYDDPEVFKIFNEQKFSGLFQFEGQAQRSVSVGIEIDCFQKIDHITALARPGPLGGGAASHYTSRNAGKEAIEYRHPSMEEYLGETMGVVLYQEQVMRIVREIGNFSWEDTSTIRKAMSGRKGKEFFDNYGVSFAKGAKRLGIDKKAAADIWYEICNFGAWGMNKSHTCSYAMISYWCAYMKRWHPVEYAAACLRNAKDDEQTIEMLREVTSEGVDYIPFDPELSEDNWVAKEGKLIGGYSNLHGIGPVKSAKYIEKRDSVGLDTQDFKRLKKHKIKNADLRPAHTMWGAYYRDPSLLNVHGRIKEFGDLEDREDAVVICKMVRNERRDQNEAVLIAKRNGEVKKGQTLFLDLFVVDDSIGKPTRARINTRYWKRLGEPIADKSIANQDWFLIRGRWLQLFNMLAVEKIRCLTNGGMFQR